MEKSIAKDLLSIGAVFLRPEQPFTWASGIKSPIYCDNRLTLTAPVVRGHVEEGLAQIVRTRFPEAEVLMGTSTAGIAHAAITATILDLPMGYVRSGSKDHGRGNQIEGKLEKGQKVVVIEDLISTGGSCIEVVTALREAGAEVLGVDLHLRHEEGTGPHERGERRQLQSLESRRAGGSGRRGGIHQARRQGPSAEIPRQSVGRKLDGKIVCRDRTTLFRTSLGGMEMRLALPPHSGRHRVQSAACRRPAANPDFDK